ncbi:MAG: hypothetical protein ACP5QO_14175, partial [Clostridia bacterium]
GTRIEYLDNPRTEAVEHYYHAQHTHLLELGLKPHMLSDTLIENVFRVVEQHRDRVNLAAIRPGVNWRRTHQTAEAWSQVAR